MPLIFFPPKPRSLSALEMTGKQLYKPLLYAATEDARLTLQKEAPGRTARRLSGQRHFLLGTVSSQKHFC